MAEVKEADCMCACDREPARLPQPRSRLRQVRCYEEHRIRLLGQLPQAMAAAHGVFGGPSLDLPVWAAEARGTARNGDAERDRFLREVYGTLLAWGMHRMGERGATMPRFETFRASILSVWPLLEALWDVRRPQTQAQWSALCRVFHAAEASTTNSRLVANAKVLALLLPDAVAVIDREYTLRFLGLRNVYTYGTHPDRAAPCFEWRLFREIHECFFYPLVDDPNFQTAVQQWPAPQEGQEPAMMGTPLRAADSMVVGFQRLGLG
ncbi:hypothetical protein ACO2Q3_12565 [Caulobacter sp. KR2-114]|uniref:hypothetical protein n=1 Tax=Caulobacter sp. KR2-114 TaxID=3400912 RepID=UPI003BFF7536